MKTKILFLCGILFFVFLIGCKKQSSNAIESIDILFFNYIFDRAIAVNCDEIQKKIPSMREIAVFDENNDSIGYIADNHGILDTTITDAYILQEIAIELGRSKKIEDDYVDARMKCYINYANGKTDTLCIDRIPIYAIYNNRPVKLTNKLVYLIRKNCGFYQWVGIREMSYFDELNDTTFVREKVKSRWGEEY